MGWLGHRCSDKNEARANHRHTGPGVRALSSHRSGGEGALKVARGSSERVKPTVEVREKAAAVQSGRRWGGERSAGVRRSRPAVR
jgi:hypothetical protein